MCDGRYLEERAVNRIFLFLSPGLLRDRLFQVFRNAGFLVFDMAGCADCTLPPPSDSGHIAHDYLVTDMNNSRTALPLLKNFIVSAPQAHIVLLIENFDPGLTQRPEISLASCVLSSSISTAELLTALNLVRSGERVIQRCLLALTVPPKNDDAAPPPIPEHRIPPHTCLNEPSPREKEILRCLVLGYTNKVIARHLGITEATVKVHLKNLLKKLHVENRTQAAIWAFNAGYVNENADKADKQAAGPAQARN